MKKKKKYLKIGMKKEKKCLTNVFQDACAINDTYVEIRIYIHLHMHT